jgi:hypothetical protein
MGTFELSNDPIAVDVEVTDSAIWELSVPVEWFPRLFDATPEQRRNWRLIGRGEGIHWPDVDEDISVIGLLAGRGDANRHPRSAA